MKINTLGAFTSQKTSFWATTYTFEPSLFDEYIFNRIGDPPINANILVDAGKLNSIWDSWKLEPWRLKRVNRHYLVRGVDFGQRAFHPKTYFIAGKKSGTLLVGSGNLGLNGLLQGQEVFVEFSSATEEGKSAIASWLEWMDGLVRSQQDESLSHRWNVFLKEADWMPKNSSQSMFIHNAEKSIFRQLVESVSFRAEEVHVLAPFYDVDCAALARLVDEFSPEVVHVYIPRDVSINGQKLNNLIQSWTCKVHLHGYGENSYVHAKLFAVVGEEQAVVLSGSANCSRPALLSTSQSGNSEVGVLSPTSPEQARSVFTPQDWIVTDLSTDDLNQLELRESDGTTRSWDYRLISARLGSDMRIEVSIHEGQRPDGLSLAVDDAIVELADFKSTVAVPHNCVPTFAWLVNGEGDQVSNLVAVDHAVSLAKTLATQVNRVDRPSELYQSDMNTGVGKILEDLNRHFIFDIDEVLTGKNRNSNGRELESEDPDANNAFWDNFDRETIRHDPRSLRYQKAHQSENQSFLGSADEVFDLLRSMLERFSAERLSTASAAAGRNPVWQSVAPSPSIKQRVGNVLMRWSLALNDKRFRWIDVTAPMTNFQALLIGLADIRLTKSITPQRSAAVTLALLQSILGSEQRHGYLLDLEDEDERALVESLMTSESAGIAAALVYDALNPSSNWRSVVFEWQPFIKEALKREFIAADDVTLQLLSQFAAVDGGYRVPESVEKVDDHLEMLATFINDTHWCKQQQQELGFHKVVIRRSELLQVDRRPYTVTLTGPVTLRIEPRVVTLLLRLLEYKKVRGAIVRHEDPQNPGKGKQIISVDLQAAESIYALDDTGGYFSPRPVTKQQLERLEEQNLGIIEILSREPN